VQNVGVTFWVVLIAYFVAIVVIGSMSARKNKNTEEFLTAGRSIGPIVGGAGLAATQMSAGTFVGTLGIHYLMGGSFLWIWSGLWLGWLINAVFVGPKFQAFGGVTVPDYVGTRYKSPIARTISAILILVVYTVYLTAQYQAGGDILKTIFGVPFVLGLVITTLATLVYTMAGGMRGTTHTDFLDIIVMLAVFVGAIPVLMHDTGGTVNIGQFLNAVNPALTHWSFGLKSLLGFGAAFGLSMATAPYELARMYTLRDKRTVKLSIGVAFIFQAIVGLGVAWAGMAMRMLFPNLSTPDIASTILSINILPPLLGALFMVAILSAVTSTVAGIMIVSGSAFSHDIYARMINKQASEKQLMRVNRIAVLVLGIVPIFLALKQIALVQFVVLLQASLSASFFFATVVLGLNWKRGTAAGAIASMITGFITALAWFFAGKPMGLDPVIPGVLISVIFYVGVSLMTSKPSLDALAPFFAEKSVNSPVDTSLEA
jgi:SSS family transporter